jgi:hypothetical protein
MSEFFVSEVTGEFVCRDKDKDKAAKKDGQGDC